MLEHLLMLIAFLDVVSTCSTNFHFLTARFRASGRGRAAGRGPGGNHDRRPQGTSNESRGNSAREPRHDYVRGKLATLQTREQSRLARWSLPMPLPPLKSPLSNAVVTQRNGLLSAYRTPRSSSSQDVSPNEK